jgi:predicted phosphate transport protein (TIGR00153 family)
MIWLGRGREREMLKLSKLHFDRVMELTKVFKEYITLYSDCKPEEYSNKYQLIFKLEREADEEKERIISEVSRGPFHPIDREDIISLVLTVDDIAANLKSASRRLLYTDSRNLPEAVRGKLVGLAGLVVEIVEKLGEAFDALIKGSKDTLRLADLVERKEEEIDEFRHDLINDVLKWGDSSGRLSDVLMVKEAVENIETASDKAEDVADLIRRLVLIRRPTS